MGKAAAGCANGFSGPIAGVLMQAGQRVEYRAFPYIWVAGKRQRKGLLSHQDIASDTVRIPVQSVRRTAITAPRIR